MTSPQPSRPKTAYDADVCVIGAGAGGLSVAAGAAQMGARTVLIERGAMGGDCLNTGCVPSKALLAAARAAAEARTAGRFGLAIDEPRIDFARVQDHVQGVIAELAANDSVARFEGLGVQVVRAEARFIGPDTVSAGGHTIRARRFVLATGSRPALPPIPGLEGLDPEIALTTDTLFQLRTCPAHLIVLGGGPAGVEMAQAHRRLGAAVTLIEAAALLGREDPELVEVLRRRLVAEGVVLREPARVVRISAGPGGATVELEDGERLAGSHLLVATGRRPNLETLNLAAAGVATTPQGVLCDHRLRTSNPRIWALGDVVAGSPALTAAANHQAGIVLRTMLFRLPARVDHERVPRVIFCDPELAQVGLTEAEARGRHRRIGILRWPLAENDRARAERAPDGLVKLVVRSNGRVLGAGIAGAGAGDLIVPWTLAIARRLPLGALAGLPMPYPTRSEAGRRAAGAFFTPRLFNDRVRALVRWLIRL
jgi:pyruvate/2-oxoglutarate dehydrogenase complex dihydrolipoamide dehydrogenase (E3) component